MRKLFLAAALTFTALSAQAATLTLPSVTFTSPASTAITCNETAAANLVVPVAAGTVIFTCTVAPSTWTGAVSLNDPTGIFTVSGLSGNTFNVVLALAISAPATDAPGTLTTVP